MKYIIVIIVSYLLGCINFGYYYIRALYKRDIRDTGSGATGASNVGRLAGKKGFAVTFAGDFLKGAAAALLGRSINAGYNVCLVGIFAVVAGHVFPLQLGFKGGKGLATAFGALIVHDPPTMAYAISICIILIPFLKDKNIAVISTMLVMPFVYIAASYPVGDVVLMVALCILFLYSFRDNIRKYRGAFKK